MCTLFFFVYTYTCIVKVMLDAIERNVEPNRFDFPFLLLYI